MTEFLQFFQSADVTLSDKLLEVVYISSASSRSTRACATPSTRPTRSAWAPPSSGACWASCSSWAAGSVHRGGRARGADGHPADLEAGRPRRGRRAHGRGDAGQLREDRHEALRAGPVAGHDGAGLRPVHQHQLARGPHLRRGRGRRAAHGLLAQEHPARLPRRHPPHARHRGPALHAAGPSRRAGRDLHGRGRGRRDLRPGLGRDPAGQRRRGRGRLRHRHGGLQRWSWATPTAPSR